MSAQPRLTTANPVEPEHDGQFINKRLRLAGVLIIIGAAVEGPTLMWNHPLSFLAFAGIGALAITLGIAVYPMVGVAPAEILREGSEERSRRRRSHLLDSLLR